MDRAVECVRAGVQFSGHISILYDIVFNNKPPVIKKDITYRKLKDIDVRQLKLDICAHDFGNSNDDIDVLVAKYNQGLSDILDKHAPIRLCKISIRPKRLLFNNLVQLQRLKLRKVERKWHNTRNPSDHAIFTTQL